jgi:hypothetical protein
MPEQAKTANQANFFIESPQWFFNLVVESLDAESVMSGPAMGVDVGENTLAASSTGRIWGGEALCHRGCQDRDGGPDAHPRSAAGRAAHAHEAAPLGVPAVAEFCRLQGSCRWNHGCVRESGLHQPELFELRATGYTLQTSFRVFLWFPGAR